MKKGRKKVLVTGASGFVGGHLVDGLLSDGTFEVHGLVRKTSKLTYLTNRQIHLHYGDLLDYDSLCKTVRGIEYIIHAGAKIKASSYHEFYQYNGLGTENILKAAVAGKCCKKFINVSTQAASSPARDGQCLCEEDAAYPVSLYGRSKRAGEIITGQYKNKIAVVSLRPVAVYGPRDRETFKYIKLVNMGIALKPGLKKTKVSIIYIKDLVSACINIINKKFPSGSIYYLSDGVDYYLRDVLKTIGLILNKKYLYLPIPEAAALFFCTMNDAIHLLPQSAELVSLDKIREMIQSWTCSIEKAKRELDFCPQFPLEVGMKETIDWYRANKWLDP